jgi:DHA1 family tetracycline resistance protein-like MFS transporter
VQGLISNSVGDDEQGTVQGAVTSLESVAGIAGPLLATSLFSYFIEPGRTPQVPGAPFFSAAVLGLLALLTAVVARRRNAAREKSRDAVMPLSVAAPAPAGEAE